MKRSKPIHIKGGCARSNYMRKHLTSAVSWQPDSAVSQCNLCRSSFSFINRKHHCRKCGRIYCGNCITHGTIPSLINSVAQSPDNTWGRMLRFSGMDSGTNTRDDHHRPRKLCITCKHNIGAAVRDEKVYKLIDSMTKSGFLSYDILCSLMMCSVSYYNACSSTQDSLCLLRQYLPFQPIGDYEGNLIRSNYCHFVETKRMDLISRSRMHIPKRIDNTAIAGSLTLHRAIEILLFHSSGTDNRILDMCRQYILTKDPSILFHYKYALACMNEQFALDVFETFSYSNQFECYFHLRTVRNELAQKLKGKDPMLGDDINLSEKLEKLIMKIAETSVREKRGRIYKTLKKLIRANQFIRFPGMFKYKVKDIRLNHITKKNSKTCPTVIPIVYTNDRGERHIQKILIKKENIISDAILMDCLHYLKHLSSEFGGIVVTYNTVPLGAGIGAIEFVNASLTIHSIEANTSLQSFILECNQKETVMSVQNKIVNSLFPQTVFQYIFGLGDRHNNNIMCTPDGLIFNIDYSTFLFGQAPTHKKMMTRKMYISQSIMNCIGENTKWYSLFAQKCQLLFSRVRDNLGGFLINTFIPMMRFVGIDESIMKDHYLERFVPSLNNEDACIVIEKLIDKSSSSTSSYRTFFDKIKNTFT